MNPILLRALALVGASGLTANAAISIVSQSDDNGNATNAIEFLGVSVNAGDVVVVSTAVNKNLTQVDFTLGTTAGAGDVSAPLSVSADEVHGAHVHYATVINAGTYDFTIDPTTANTFTSNSTIYVLRAGSGEIEVADTATVADTGAPTDTTLSYTFASAIAAGDAVAVEALATQSGAVTVDADYTLGVSGGSGKRNTASSIAVAGSAWSATHTLAPDNDDFVGAGAVFVEVIPEPSSALLLLGGLVPFVLSRRRR